MAQNFKSRLASLSLHTRARFLKPIDIILDIGANRGLITSSLAKITRAKIVAYEPDPVPFAELADTTKDLTNVIAYNKAVSNKNSKSRLFLHESQDQNRLAFSTGSSLCLEKNNVNHDNYIDVDCIDIVDIVSNYEVISLMKLDVEGAEIDILYRLITSGVWKSIKKVYVETHENKMDQGYAKQLIELKYKTAQLKWNINYEWK